MKTCIICREEKENFNDEHVIPDSIQGYYHIDKVCTECNSKLGSTIDNTLTNHKFIEFQRHLLNIKGKSGNIPNPLKGLHTMQDDPTQKVLLEVDEEGKFIPRLLPNIPDFKNEGITDSFTIRIDKKDEDKLDQIMDKILKRNGLDKSKITTTKISGEKVQPWLHSTLKIDIHDFKAGILKIAYEFAVDTLPEYFNDDHAKVISKVLLEADFENLEKKVNFLGSGFDKLILKPFEHFVEFENNNHYLILASTDLGLLCFVNLFNAFSICVKLSERTDYFEDNLFVGKNDIVARTYKCYDITQLLQSTYTPMTYRFKYWFPDLESANELFQMEKLDSFGYYSENNKIPFYNDQGNVVYKSIDDKLLTLPRIAKGDTINAMITEFVLDEKLFIRLLPSNKLFAIDSVRTEQYRISKI
jgi:hypothetical protein